MSSTVNRKKHQYLINGGKIPRRTAYRRRIEQQLKTRQLFENQATLEVQHQESSDDEFENTGLTANNEVSSGSIDNLYSLNDDVCGFGNDEDDDDLSSSHESIIGNGNTVMCSSTNNDSTCSDTSNPCNERAHTVSEVLSYSDEVHEMSDDEEERDLDLQDEEANNIQRELNDPNLISESASGSNANKNPLVNRQLCPCSPTTEGDALLYCLALGIRHNLSWVAIVDILKMINLLYGYEAVTATKYNIQKLFYKHKNATYHLYCSECESYLGVKGEDGLESKCECCGDEENSESNAETSFFVSVNLADQFKSLLQREEMANDILTYRFRRDKVNRNNNYEDIYDGHAYKSMSENSEMLGNPHNFSYTWSTDGVQIGKSTKNAAWPIFVSINELSPQNRKRNMVFAGVWVGKKQPNMRIFLKPFVEEVNRLSDEGFFWVDSQNVQQHSKAFPLCCVVDSAARYKLLNLTSYTGYYGCTFCYQRAENTKVGRRFTVQSSVPPRTHQSMIDDMKNVFIERNNPNKKEKIIKGCKGYTPLVLIKYLSLDNAFVVDSMHNSFLGVAKTHAKLFLTTCGTQYYIGSSEKITTLDGVLLQISPPTVITRTPRSIDEWKMWKASEWRSWLLFYSLVCLQGLVPAKYMYHLALFSSAIYLLLQRSITHAEILLANNYLRKYVYLTQEYFGKTAMLYNFHLLTHLCQGVINYGPLWTHSAFQFEGENHYFMQMLTSPGHIAKQLVMRYSVFSEYPTLCKLYSSCEKPMEFLNKITGKALKSYIKQDGCLLVGQGNLISFDSVETLLEPLLPEYQSVTVNAFQRMILGGVRYSTSNYAKGKKNDDSYISLSVNMKARIEKILHVTLDCATASVIVIATPFNVRLPDFLKTSLVEVVHIKEIVKTARFVAIRPSAILGQCIYMKLNDKEILADIPFGCHSD